MMEDELFKPEDIEKKEAPPVEAYSPEGVFVKSGEFEYSGGCWCEKPTGTAGCDGGPVKVEAWKHFANFVCPRGRRLVHSVPVALKNAARQKGLIS